MEPRLQELVQQVEMGRDMARTSGVTTTGGR
jgi:hypothetical protein